MGKHTAPSLHDWFACARSYQSAQQHRLQVETDRGLGYSISRARPIQSKAQQLHRTAEPGRWVHEQRTTYKTIKLSLLQQDRIDRLNGVGFGWTQPMGRSRKKKALSNTREQSSSRRMRVPPLSTVESDGVKGQRFDSEPSLPLLLQVPSSKSNHSHGTSESNDEVDEIGALIYDQVMHNKGDYK